ncbi:mannitol dehydrogenase [Paenibacillus macerans]|nr:mannitol dehydrogenase [Paenibacillus macerans]
MLVLKAVHFGAGSIGRGFIGDLLHASGYEITFVDVDPAIIAQINRDKAYDLYVIEQNYARKTIDHVCAVSSVTQEQEAVAALADADIITTSVWADNLPRIAPVLLKGLRARREAGKSKVNILACENAMFNSDILRSSLLSIEGGLSAEELAETAAFPNTAVDRLVLEDEREGRKVINIGQDFELVIEQNKLAEPGSIPIQNAVYADNLLKFLERKLYIINCGHAWAGYIGHIYGYEIIQDVFQNDALLRQILEAMMESAGLLERKYGFAIRELAEYVDFAVARFRTPGIVDTIGRVCRSPIRKLQPDDRLVGPCLGCEAYGLKNDRLLQGIAAAFLFRNPEDAQSEELRLFIEKHGIGAAITRYTGIAETTRLHQAILHHYEELSRIKRQRWEEKG